VTPARLRSTLFLAHLLPARIRNAWWRLWTKDPHALACCSFCGATRGEAGWLVEAEHAYICDRCVMLSLGVLAAKESATLMVGAFDTVLANRTAEPATIEETDALLRSVVVLGAVDTRAYEIAATHATRLGRDEIAREARARVPPGYR
jgi:hypothetical protein